MNGEAFVPSTRRTILFSPSNFHYPQTSYSGNTVSRIKIAGPRIVEKQSLFSLDAATVIQFLITEKRSRK